MNYRMSSERQQPTDKLVGAPSKSNEKDDDDNEQPQDEKVVAAVSILGGLAGSSCCLLQLILHLLSDVGLIHFVGCAGFNVLFGPIRVYVRIATLVYFMNKWWRRRRLCCNKERLRLYILLGMCLMFLPETLRFVTKVTGTSGFALAPSTSSVEKRVYTVDNMGCEACEYHVRQIVGTSDGVVSVQDVQYETGLLEIWIHPDWNFNADQLDARLEAKGYDLLPAGSTTKKMKLDAQWSAFDNDNPTGGFVQNTEL